MLLFLNIGGGELMVIALFVLMFFGSKQIPELMRGLGKGMREVRDAMNGIEREVRQATSLEDEPRNQRPTSLPDKPETPVVQNSSSEEPKEIEDKNPSE